MRHKDKGNPNQAILYIILNISFFLYCEISFWNELFQLPFVFVLPVFLLSAVQKSLTMSVWILNMIQLFHDVVQCDHSLCWWEAPPQQGGWCTRVESCKQRAAKLIKLPSTRQTFHWWQVGADYAVLCYMLQYFNARPCFDLFPSAPLKVLHYQPLV